MTVLDLPPQQRAAQTSFEIELFDGDNLAACNWPSIADSRDLRMYVFQSREFIETWASTIGRANRIKPYLLLVRNNDSQAVLYLPLAIETKFNIRLLRFMDCGVADYNAPILQTGLALSRQDFNALWRKALSMLPDFDVVDLKKIARDVAGAVNPLTYLDCTRHSEDGHSLLLKGADMPTGSDIPVGQRRALDREHRRMSELGDVEFIVNPRAIIRPVTEKLFELKRQKYVQTKVRDFLAMPGVADFYREILNTKIGHLSALLVGNAVVSAHIGYAGRGRFYYILPAYDPAYSRYRPGYLLLRELIGRAAQQGAETFDFGFGDETYKQVWTNHRLPLYDYERAITTAGRVYLQMRRVRQFIKGSGIRSWLRRPAERSS